MSATLPALGNSLLRTVDLIHQKPPPPSSQYVQGFCAGYSKGYLAGLYAFQPLVPRGFLTPYRTAVELLKKECESKLAEELKVEVKSPMK